MSSQNAALEAANRRIAELEAEVVRLTDAAQRESRSKDEFLAMLSHELRTPLNVILGWIQLLRLHLEDPDERSRAVDVLERNLRSQAQTIANLLDASRIITGRMRLASRRVVLERVIQRAIEPLRPGASAKHVTLVADLQPGEEPVYGDAARLQQVVWNLVSNAVRFTQSGGVVTVRLRQADHHAQIEVTDTGIGIPRDLLPFVFDRFRQADSTLTRPFGGLGLGLAIVRHLVELHGGTVTAESGGPGRGATFIVALPTGVHSGSPQDADWVLHHVP